MDTDHLWAVPIQGYAPLTIHQLYFLLLSHKATFQSSLILQFASSLTRSPSFFFFFQYGMKIFATASVLALVVASQSAVDAQPPVAEPGTPAFLKHRPVFHFLARKNWMNDPCAPYYDAETDLYHMFYQSNPANTTWGNMTWGHAVSKNQVTWTDYPDALENNGPWDSLGVFSGFARTKAIDGKDTVFYTGVTKLPISWTKEYLFGEHVNYATTSDQGKTWQKGATPLIELPPKGLNVTGWRDPNVFDSKSLDAAFGLGATNSNSSSHYLITAGGLHGIGPRIFLYHSTDYRDWKYKGYLLSQPKNTTFSKFSGNWGYNFETTNFVELSDEEGVVHNVMLFAAEGTPRRFPMWAVGAIRSAVPVPASSGQASVCSDGQATDSDAEKELGLFQPSMVGVTEYSDWYANAVFQDPKTGKFIVWGWIIEDNGSERQPQGWNGILSLPRQVEIAMIRDIYDPENQLDVAGDWIVSSTRDVPGPCTLASGSAGSNTELLNVRAKTTKTLAFSPSPQLDLLRGDKIETLATVTLAGQTVEKVLQSTGKSFELFAKIISFEEGSQVGFTVRRSANKDEFTSIFYDDKAKKIVIDRSKSFSSSRCGAAPSTGQEPGALKPNTNATEGFFHHYQQVVVRPGQQKKCEITREPLTFRIYVDVSVIEVFVNDRFVISSRVYPCDGTTSADSDSDGISLMTTGGKATFEDVKVWTNPKKAWQDVRSTVV